MQWLTVPVKVKGKYLQTIRETEIDGDRWARKHWQSLCQNYRRAAHFKEIAEIIEPLYLKQRYTYLSVLNRAFIESVCAYLGITTAISDSSDYELAPGQTARLVHLCEQVGGQEYVSGPAAKNYIEESVFHDRGLKLTWFDYTGYPRYPQLWGDFEHGVSILDLLFNCGRAAGRYMRYVQS
jgi:hypothetical protein